jgi:hypothetical protein
MNLPADLYAVTTWIYFEFCSHRPGMGPNIAGLSRYRTAKYPCSILEYGEYIGNSISTVEEYHVPNHDCMEPRLWIDGQRDRVLYPPAGMTLSSIKIYQSNILSWSQVILIVAECESVTPTQSP